MYVGLEDNKMRLVCNLIITGCSFQLLIFNLIGCGEEETTRLKATEALHITESSKRYLCLTLVQSI